MRYKNLVQLEGEADNVKKTDGGLFTFKMKVLEEYKTASGEEKCYTAYFAVKAFGKLADEMNNTIQPGANVSVKGKISNNKYTDKNGTVKYFTEVVVNEFNLIS